MRIIGGTYKGKKIQAPNGLVSRPTTDRTRESLFNILAHHEEVDLEGARVLDCFAGSGALGLEALSRGASHCLFIDIDAHARGAIRNNIENLNLYGQTRIQRRSATALGNLPTTVGGAFDLVFLDPPYNKNLCAPALKCLDKGSWLKPHAILIIEQSASEAPAQATHFEVLQHRRYGNTQIGLYQYQKA